MSKLTASEWIIVAMWLCVPAIAIALYHLNAWVWRIP